MTAFFVTVIVALLALGYVMGNSASTTVKVTFNPAGTPSQPGSGNVTFGYKSDGSLTGVPITQNPKTWPGDDKYDAICTAVALAEGYSQGVGTAPYDLNNPGDLSPGDEHGQQTCGPAQYHGGSEVIFFCTVELGWTALRTKFVDIVNGNSRVYAKTDTWADVAAKYAGNAGAWLANVTSYLGVDPSSTPADYVRSA